MKDGRLEMSDERGMMREERWQIRD